MAEALCSETFLEFQMNKWLGKFSEQKFFSIAVIGDRNSLTGPFLRNIVGTRCSCTHRLGLPAPSCKLRSVQSYQTLDYVDGVEVSATLIPALSDAEGYKDEGYFTAARGHVQYKHLLFYLLDMSDTRLHGSVLRTLQELKPDWSRTVFILTFADALPALVRHRDNTDFPKVLYFNTKVAEWTRELKAILQRIGVKQKVVTKLSVYPIADGPADLLPNGEPWLPPLSLAVMDILSTKKKAKFLKKHATLLPSVIGIQLAMLSRSAELNATKKRVSRTSEVLLGIEKEVKASVSSVLSKDQSRSIRAALSKLRKDCPMFGVLVIGRTGVGKSTLINNLLGKEVASVGHTLRSKTSTVYPYEESVEGVPIVVYDTPGLGDLKGKKEEKMHLDIMKDFLARKKIHLIVYCFQMNETMMTSSLVGAMKKYHEIGVDWERSVITLTFADALYVPKSDRKCPEFEMSQYFNERFSSQRGDLRYELKNTVGVKHDVVERLKICPTSLLPTDQLPNGNPWYVPLWLHIAEILSPAATVRFLDMHRNNISNEDAPPQQSKCVKLELKLNREGTNRLTNIIAVTVEAAGMDSSEVIRALSQSSVGEIHNLLIPGQVQPRGAVVTAANSPQSQTQQSGKESILSQNVYVRQGHLMLLREHVSRKAAGKGRAVLEGLWIDAAVIEACFTANPLDEEGAVQAGIIKWTEGIVGHQPPTWSVLLKAMRFARIAQQHIHGLEKDLSV